MKSEQDPLQTLVVIDAKSVNRQRLANFLKDYVALGADGAMSFLPPFNKIGNDGKVEIILAASKARSLLFPDHPDGMTPSQVIGLDVLPPGSVKTSLKRLYDDRKIKKDSSGRYILPGYRLDEITEKAHD